MNLNTVTVSGQINRPDGAPAAGATVRFALNALGVDGLALVVPRYADAVCDAQGAFAAQVVPSPAGTYYEVRIGWADAVLLRVRSVVPANNCQLTQIMQALPHPPLDAAQRALLDLQAAQAGIEVQRQGASASAAEALQSAQAAGVSAEAAEAARALAAADAQNASDSATAASHSAFVAGLAAEAVSAIQAAVGDAAVVVAEQAAQAVGAAAAATEQAAASALSATEAGSAAQQAQAGAAVYAQFQAAFVSQAASLIQTQTTVVQHHGFQ